MPQRPGKSHPLKKQPPVPAVGQPMRHVDEGESFTLPVPGPLEIVRESANTRLQSAIVDTEPLSTPDKIESPILSELSRLKEMLTQELRDSIAELKSSQTAAAEAQSTILRTLTEAVVRSSTSHDISPESIERAFSGVETRLIRKIEAIAETGTAMVPDTGLQALSPSTPTANPGPAAASANQPSKVVSGAVRSWAEIRSEMLAADGVGESCSAEPERNAELPELPAVTQLSSDRHFRLPVQDPSLEVPEAVDPDGLSLEQLRDAFREREIFITTLIARVRRQQEAATVQLSAEQLRSLVTDLPEELAVQVRHTLKQMDDLARMGELELSLERARIARQISQLEHSRHTMERNARQLGLQLNSDGTISAPSSQPGRSTSSRRWLGKLGFGQ
jgi:hypothetical protein